MKKISKLILEFADSIIIAPFHSVYFERSKNQGAQSIPSFCYEKTHPDRGVFFCASSAAYPC